MKELGIMFLSLITVATISLLSPGTAQIIVQPGYNNPSYGYQMAQPYKPINYPVHYSAYPRSSLASEYQRYQNLNQLVQQQITGIMQSDPNQLQSTDASLGSSAYRHLHPLRPHYVRPYYSGGKIYSITPHGLRGYHSHKYMLRSPDQATNYDQPMSDAVHNPSTRSVQSNDTTCGSNSTTASHVTNYDDVATNTTVVPEDLPEVQSLNESEDKHVDSRSTITDNLLGSAMQPYHQIQVPNDNNQPMTPVIFNRVQSETPMESVGAPASPAQIFDQIRPDFSQMQLYNGGQVSSGNERMMEEASRSLETDRSAHPHKEITAAHPSYSESKSANGNWLTDTYRNYVNKARTFMQPGYTYPGQSSYPSHRPYSSYPVAPMMQPAAPMMQPAAPMMQPAASMYPGPFSSYGGYNPYNGPASATASSTASATANYHNPYMRTAMDFVGKGLTYQPSDWARYGQNWANQGANMLGTYFNNNPMRNQPQGHSAWY